jgi:hypothetical protein
MINCDVRTWHDPEGPRRRNISDSYLGYKRRASVGLSAPLSWPSLALLGHRPSGRYDLRLELGSSIRTSHGIH